MSRAIASTHSRLNPHASLLLLAPHHRNEEAVGAVQMRQHAHAVRGAAREPLDVRAIVDLGQVDRIELGVRGFDGVDQLFAFGAQHRAGNEH